MGIERPIDLERFRGVVAIQQAIHDARGELDTVMNAIVRETSVMPQSNGVVVELRDVDQIHYAAASGTSAPLIGLRLPLNKSLSGRCILTGEPLRCDDSERDPRVNLQACRKVGLRSMIVIPIPHRGQTVGVLKYHAPEPHAFDEQDMLMAHLLVGPITVGMSSVGEADALKAETELRSVVALKEALVSNVSHELRTPLTSISGSLMLLGRGAAGVLPPRASDLVDLANRNAGRLRKLVDDLLEVGKLEAGQLRIDLQPVDLGTLLREAITQSSPFASQFGVTIVLDHPAAPVIAVTDADRVTQAVTNLLSNAVKYSPFDASVRVTLAQNDDAAVIRVADTGPGVPPDFRARLFDRFSQAAPPQDKPALPGTGLGLAITKGLVERLGGTIRLDPTVTTGATFEIRLPTEPIDIGHGKGPGQ